MKGNLVNDFSKIYCISYFLVCRMGDYVTLGGRVAVRDHVSIASKVFHQTRQCGFSVLIGFAGPIRITISLLWLVVSFIPPYYLPGLYLFRWSFMIGWESTCLGCEIVCNLTRHLMCELLRRKKIWLDGYGYDHGFSYSWWLSKSKLLGNAHSTSVIKQI